jgi:hypothetical protein
MRPESPGTSAPAFCRKLSQARFQPLEPPIDPSLQRQKALDPRCELLEPRGNTLDILDEAAEHPVGSLLGGDQPFDRFD